MQSYSELYGMNMLHIKSLLNLTWQGHRTLFNGTSYHCIFRKCLINPNNLIKHCRIFYFQTALTSTSEDNIDRTTIARILTLTLT